MLLFPCNKRAPLFRRTFLLLLFSLRSLSGEPEPESHRQPESEEREKQDRRVAAVLGDAHLVAHLLGEAATGAAALRAHEPTRLLSCFIFANRERDAHEFFYGRA